MLARTLIVCLICTTAAPMLLAQEQQTARDVSIRFFLLDLPAIDTVAQTFDANLTLVMRWQDDTLAHNGPESISRNLDEVWHPRIQLLNQRNVRTTLPWTVEIRPDGEVIQRQRYWGTFSHPLDLAEFPFDTQRLEIRLAHIAFTGQPANLSAAADSTVSENLTVSDWTLLNWRFEGTSFALDSSMQPIDGMVFVAELERDGQFFIYKVFMPLILIVMMSWLAFWLDPSLVASQISLTITAMLTMIAYRFVLQGMMPRLAFLTSLDYFVLGATFMVFLSMVEVVYTAHLFAQGNLDRARRVDRHARWAAPLIFLAIGAETHYFRFWV